MARPKKKKQAGGSFDTSRAGGRYIPGRPGPGGINAALTMPKPAPPRPPVGYYDPSIDAQVSAGRRGLGDLRIDIGTAKRRGEEDYGTALTALGTTRGNTFQDYQTALKDTDRNYGILASNQAEGARAHGVTSGGLAAQSAAIREANKGRDVGRINTQYGRALDDINNRQTLLDRDYTRQYGLGGDLDLQLTRAEREQPFLESDANALRLFQANQAGYLPPTGTVRFGKPRPRKRGNRMSG